MRFCNANINDSLGVLLFLFLLRSQRFQAKNVTVLGSFRETALIVEAGLTGDYVPARV
jgi:hypothetical protein